MSPGGKFLAFIGIPNDPELLTELYYSSTILGQFDFCSARSFGVPGETVTDVAALVQFLQWLYSSVCSLDSFSPAPIYVA